MSMSTINYGSMAPEGALRYAPEAPFRSPNISLQVQHKLNRRSVSSYIPFYSGCTNLSVLAFMIRASSQPIQTPQAAFCRKSTTH